MEARVLQSMVTQEEEGVRVEHREPIKVWQSMREGVA